MQLKNQFSMFERYRNTAVKTLIEKALSADSASGGALAPQNLEQLITQTIIRLSPEMALLSPRQITAIQHDFNRLTSMPTRGGAMGDGADTERSAGVYTRASVALKVIRRIGEVTGFLSDGTTQNAEAIEMENHLLAHIQDICYYNTWGNELANQYEHGGLDRFVSTNRRIAATGGASLALADLDLMLAKNTRAGGESHRKVFLMSPEMLTWVSGLVNYFRLNENGSPMNEMRLNAGWILRSYRGVPIIQTTYTRPTTKMGSVTTGQTTATGGTVPNGTYYLYLAAVTLQGEQAASGQLTATTSGGNNAITLSGFSAPSDVMAYKVYLTSTISSPGTAYLVKELPAFTYDSAGKKTGNVSTITVLSTTADSSVPSNMQLDIPFTRDPASVAPEEYVVLWDLDEIQGMGKYPYTNKNGDRMNGLITLEPLAKTDDRSPFLIKTYGALTPAYEGTSYIYRGARAV